MIFFLVPLLFEAQLEKKYDEIWTVTTKEDILIERLKARTTLGEDELFKRIAAQMSQKDKAARSNSVIENSGSMSDTEAQVIGLLNKLDRLKKR